MASTTLFMPMLNEGTDVWRPVVAEILDDGTFRILGPVPDDEEWTFAPGSVVTARPRIFANGEEQLVAALPG